MKPVRVVPMFVVLRPTEGCEGFERLGRKWSNVSDRCACLHPILFQNPVILRFKLVDA